jgi:tryptophanyl-tRNA synthetase
VACKQKLIEVLVALLEPIGQRRAQYEKDPHYVKQVLQTGTAKANAIAEDTLRLAKEAMSQRYF